MTLFRGKKVPAGMKLLKPVKPSIGIEVAYRRALLKMIDEMHKSVNYWIEATYKNNEPKIAVAFGSDASPANALRIAMSKLTRQWQSRFDEAAQRMADHFATAAEERSSAALKKILKDSGWSVKFKMTPAQRDIFASTVNQNVALIKSIPQQYLGDVEGLVQRSVQSGRDLQQLTEDLQKRYKVTRNRAELIARDQNNKATSAFERARQQELGITEAIWVHSHAGKVPRPTHVKMDGKKYDVAKGMWDPAVREYIFPGQLINCRCFSRSIIPGLN